MEQLGYQTGYTGFEPVNAAVKVLCLTTWRMPNALPRFLREHHRLSDLIRDSDQLLQVSSKLLASKAL